jgi:transcriptional regulator with XRE-family HTH domain
MEAANAAELLRRARLHRGISQEALAVRAGLTQADIAEIEDDQTSPTLCVLNELLHLLGEQLILAAETRETGIDLTLNQSNLELSVEQRVEKGLGFADFVRRNRGGGAEGLGCSLRLGPLLHSLNDAAVDFVVIGSIGGLVYGSAYPTYDLDVAYFNGPENLRRLASALEKLGLQATVADLARHPVQSFHTNLGVLDLVAETPGVRGYEELRRDACQELIAGVPVYVASLNHLIAMKRVSKERKDQLMVMEYVEIADEIRRREKAGDED